MSKTTNISARPVPTELHERSKSVDRCNKKPEVDVKALQKDLQNKRKLLNLLEEKGVTHQIDVRAIDKALADLNAIIESKGRS